MNKQIVTNTKVNTRESLDEYIQSNEMTMEFMNMSKSSYYNFISMAELSTIIFEGKKYYKIKELECYIDKREKWLLENIDRKQVVELLGGEGEFKRIKKIYNIKPVSKPFYASSLEYNTHTTFYNKDEILEILNLENRKIINIKDRDEKYIALSKACDILDLSKKNIMNLITEKNAEYIVEKIGSNDTVLIDISFIEEIKELQRDFFDKYYLSAQVRYMLPDKTRSKLKRTNAPNYTRLRTLRTTSICYAYDKKEVDEMIEIYNESKHSDYITKSEAKKVLSMTDKLFVRFCREYNLKSVCLKNKLYYLKSDIYFFKEQQSHLGDRYITSKMAKEIYGINNVASLLKGTLLPSFCFNKSIPPGAMYYDREDIEVILKNKQIKEKSRNVYGENDFETFRNRLGLYDEIREFNDSIYTKEKWFNYVNFKIKCLGKSSRKHRERQISTLVLATLSLNELLKMNNVNEIYELTSAKINLWYKGVKDCKKRTYLYKYMELVSNDITLKVKNIKSKNKGFDFSKIIRYDDKCFELSKKKLIRKSNGVYSYKEYIELFRHLINLKHHVKKSIDYINEDNITYLSTWLYCLLHLNNAWRHGDVSDFPRLKFDDLLDLWRIDSIEWFLTNEITIAQSRRIISRIIQYDFRVSKTEVYGHFFSSDTLSPAIATAILMLESFYRDSYVDRYLDYSQPIMEFNNEYNQPTEKMVSECIEGCSIKQFEFSSLKMNRSVLTFIYNISCKISPSGYNVLMLPKYMRKHINENSTLEYIEFNMEELEFLSQELFQRGELGYIVDSLLNLVCDKSENSIDRTTEIGYVRALFGGYQKVEGLVRMLNTFDDKNEIIKLLNEYTYEKCISIVSNLSIGNLVSRKQDIQCLISRESFNCINGGDCENCRFHIPSIYTLWTLCNSLKEEISIYFSTSNRGKKIKLSSRIHRKIDTVIQAISKYGQEYVYNCMDIEREEFLVMINEVKSVGYLID
ncbi:hypothetical protein [Paraclostridium sordellii]|uniref:hypothetical protein n=1 Tax=Paraclostridium sordellii TaxID=1505 RepID=UPI0030D41982